MDACNFILGGLVVMAHDVPAWRCLRQNVLSGLM
jgi:hypothetical protein